MFPRLRLLFLCTGVPVLIGLAVAWIVSLFAEAVGNYEIHFRAAADGSTLICGRPLDEIGEAKATVNLVDFRFVVSSVELIRYDGQIFPLALEQDGVWQRRDVALIDLEDATGACEHGTGETRRVIRGSAPKGNYRGVRFMLGRPDRVDAADPALVPILRAAGMQSAAPGSFEPMRIDLATEPPLQNPAVASAGAVRIALRLGSPIQVSLQDFQPERHAIVADVGSLASRVLVGQEASSGARVCEPASDDSMCHDALRGLGFAVGNDAARARVFFLVEGRR